MKLRAARWYLSAGFALALAGGCTVDLSGSGDGTDEEDSTLAVRIAGQWETSAPVAGFDSIVITSLAFAEPAHADSPAVFVQTESLSDTSAQRTYEQGQYVGLWLIDGGYLHRAVQFCLSGGQVQTSCAKTFADAAVSISGDTLRLGQGLTTTLYVRK